MKRITFEDILGYVFKFVVVSFTVIFLISILTKFNTTIEEKTIEKVSTEIMDNIMASKLVTNGVFNATELDKFDGTLIEPYVRHCRYAYKLKVECLDMCDKKWEFGYKTDDKVGDDEKYKLRLVGGVYINGIIAPAKIELDVSSNSFTRLSCMVEKAYRIKEIYEIQKDFCGRDALHYLTFKKDGNSFFYIYSSNDGLKRYFPSDIEFEDMRPKVTLNNIKISEIMKVVPIKKGYVSQLTGLCEDIPKEAIAQPSDNNIIVILCFMSGDK